MNTPSKHWRWACAMVLTMGLASSLSAQVLKIVPHGTEETFIAGSEIIPGFPFSGQTADWTPPSHGVLYEDEGGLLYEPGLDFWEAGFDSFRVHSGHLPPSGISVFLIADLKRDVLVGDPLVGCQIDPSWTEVGGLGNVVVQQSPDGFCALLFSLGGSEGYLESINAQTGPGGGNTSITIDPGRPIGEGGTTDLPAGFAASFAAGVTSTGSTVFEVELREGFELVAKAFKGDGTEVSTSPILLDFEYQKIELNWWFASAPGAADGGLLLLRDGVLEATLTGIDNFDFIGQEWSWSIGLLEPTPGAAGVLRMRDLGVWTSPQQPVFEPLFADSASDGTLNAWSAVVNPQKVSVLLAQPGGDREISMTVSPRTSVSLVDDSPASERQYKASFVLGVSGINALTGTIWTLFQGQADEERPSYRPPFSLEVRSRPLEPGFEIRAVAQDSLVATATAWVELPTSPRMEIFLQWWASQGPAENNGGLLLKIDGELEAELQGLANDAARIDKTSLGLISAPFGMGGKLILDDFVAWR